MHDALRLAFDRQFYSVEALQKAAYRAQNTLSVQFDTQETEFGCTLTPSLGVSDKEFAQGVEDFRKNALDYQMRARLSEETESVRNLILGIAFSQTGLQNRE